jgi:hypothetical protein
MNAIKPVRISDETIKKRRNSLNYKTRILFIPINKIIVRANEQK